MAIIGHLDSCERIVILENSNQTLYISTRGDVAIFRILNGSLVAYDKAISALFVGVCWRENKEELEMLSADELKKKVTPSREAWLEGMVSEAIACGERYVKIYYSTILNISRLKFPEPACV